MNIVYVAFRGHFSDSPRALYEELRARGVDAVVVLRVGQSWLKIARRRSRLV